MHQLAAHAFDINVVAVNDAPTASSDSIVVDEDSLVTPASVLGNDSDLDGDVLNATLVSGPTNATTFVLNSNGTFSYQPATNFSGTDSFSYRVSDGNGGSDIATVDIQINPVNDVPDGVADEFTVAPSSALNELIGVLANDSDIENDPLTAVLVDSPSHGIVLLARNGTFQYIPFGNFVGTDTFTYVANDGAGNSEPITVTILIAAGYESDSGTESVVGITNARKQERIVE